MLLSRNPSETQSWAALQEHYTKMREVHMRDLFTGDSNRFTNFSVDSGDLLFDYSKNRIISDTLHLLIDLANECGVREAIAAMFSGEKINATEKRAVLHTALRNFSN